METVQSFMYKSLLVFLGFFPLLGLGQDVIELEARLPDALHEISGIVSDDEGFYWAINDSGNEPLVYRLNAAGEIVKTTRISNAQNVDWEDLAIDNKGHIYIADIGNNLNKRKSLTIYKVKEKRLLYNSEVEAEIIEINYADQKSFPPKKNRMNYDAEALIHHDRGLLLFTKNRTEPYSGYSYLYRFPDTTGTYAIEPIDSIYTGEIREASWITGADISPDGRHIILLSYSSVLVLSDFFKKEYFSGIQTSINLEHFSQKESVCFANDTLVLMADEKNKMIGQNLYSLNLAPSIQRIDSIRKQEAHVLTKTFEKDIDIRLDLSLKADVYFELYDNFGNLLDYDKVGDFPKGEHQFIIPTSNLLNATYLLNIIVGNRPHAFMVKKYKAMSKEEEKEEILKLHKGNH